MPPGPGLPLRTNLPARGPAPRSPGFPFNCHLYRALAVCHALGFLCCHIQSKQAHEVSAIAFYGSTFEEPAYGRDKGVCPRPTRREELIQTQTRPHPTPHPPHPRLSASERDHSFAPALGSGVPAVGGQGAGGSGDPTWRCREKPEVQWAQWAPSLEGLNSELTAGLSAGSWAPGASGCVLSTSPTQEEPGGGQENRLE